MRSKYVKQVVLSGLFFAAGLILPTVFHAFGIGSTFLPMHIPVLLAGFFVNMPYAAAVGALTPFVSSIFTGMPPFFPVMPYMVFELAAYGATASLLYRKLKLNVYIALVGSMVAGRIAAGLAVWALATFFAAKLPGPIIFISGAVTKGIPGIIIQLVFIPSLVMILKKYSLTNREALRHES